MRPRPTNPISPSAEGRAAAGFEARAIARTGFSGAPLGARGGLGSCFGIGTPGRAGARRVVRLQLDARTSASVDGLARSEAIHAAASLTARGVLSVVAAGARR